MFFLKEIVMKILHSSLRGRCRERSGKKRKRRKKKVKCFLQKAAWRNERTIMGFWERGGGRKDSSQRETIFIKDLGRKRGGTQGGIFFLEAHSEAKAWRPEGGRRPKTRKNDE